MDEEQAAPPMALGQHHHGPGWKTMADGKHHQVVLLKIDEWLANLDADSLENILHMMSNLLDFQDPKFAVTHRLGQVATILHIKHGRCHCGLDHEKEALERLAEEAASGRPVTDGVWERAAILTPAGYIQIDLDTASGKVRCISCGKIFASADARFVDGPNCPGCGVMQ